MSIDVTFRERLIREFQARRGVTKRYSLRAFAALLETDHATLILSKAPDETAKFYSSLFGWTTKADNAIGYRQIDTGSTSGIQGGIWPAPPQAPNFVHDPHGMSFAVWRGEKGP